MGKRTERLGEAGEIDKRKELKRGKEDKIAEMAQEEREWQWCVCIHEYTGQEKKKWTDLTKQAVEDFNNW